MTDNQEHARKPWEEYPYGDVPRNTLPISYANLMADRAKLVAALKEMVQAMHDYSMDVEGDAPQKHIDMMERAYAALEKAGNR